MACEIKENTVEADTSKMREVPDMKVKPSVKPHVREVQNYQTQRQSYGNL